MKRAFIMLVVPFLVPAAWAQPSFDAKVFLCAMPRHGIFGDFAPIVRLRVSEDGAIIWNDIPASANQFAEYLTYVKNEDPRPEFDIAVASNTPFRVIQPIVENVQSAGVAWIKLSIPNGGRIKIACGLGDLRERQMPAKLHVGVYAGAAVSWNGWPIKTTQLIQYARKAAHDKPQPVVDIWPDHTTTYADIIETMKLLIGAGLQDFAIGPYGHFVPESRAKPN